MRREATCYDLYIFISKLKTFKHVNSIRSQMHIDVIDNKLKLYF